MTAQELKTEFNKVIDGVIAKHGPSITVISMETAGDIQGIISNYVSEDIGYDDVKLPECVEVGFDTGWFTK